MTPVKDAFRRHTMACNMSHTHREFTLNLSRNSLKNQAFIEKAMVLSFFRIFECEY